MGAKADVRWLLSHAVMYMALKLDVSNFSGETRSSNHGHWVRAASSSWMRGDDAGRHPGKGRRAYAPRQAVRQGGVIQAVYQSRVVSEAVHKGTSNPDEHQAIVTRALWDRVHAIFQEVSRKRAAHTTALPFASTKP